MSSCNLVPDEAAPASGRPLTGWKVLGILFGFFGVIFAVNGLMAYLAVSTFSGEVEPHAYDHGIAYNRDIAAAREQAARAWKVDVSLEPRASGETLIAVVARDAKGVELDGVSFDVHLDSPVDGKQNLSVKLGQAAPGHYEASIKAPAGARDFVLTGAQEGREVFRSRSRVKID